MESPTNSQTAPEQTHHAQRLEDGDRTPTFDFFGLPPELRNEIYRNLLVMNNPLTCYPQILCVSKAVYSEAVNILYGDNLIGIKVYRDGVFLHGKMCGDYEFDAVHGVLRRQKKSGELKWAEFIRRAQFVRFSIETGNQPVNTAQRWMPSIGSLHYIVHSLCLFLARGHKLRSFVLDLSQLRDLYAANGARSDFENHVEIALCPLRLLSSIKKLRVEGTTTDLRSISTPSTLTCEAADRFLSASLWSIIQQMHSTHLTGILITFGGRVIPHDYVASCLITQVALFSVGVDIPSRLRHAYLQFSVWFLRVGSEWARLLAGFWKNA